MSVQGLHGWNVLCTLAPRSIKAAAVTSAWHSQVTIPNVVLCLEVPTLTKPAPPLCNSVAVKPLGRSLQPPLSLGPSPLSLLSRVPCLRSYHSLSRCTVQLLRERLPVATEGIRLPVCGSRRFLGHWKINLSCAVGINT